MTISIRTGGGSVLKARWRGSTTLTPSPCANHSFPSRDLVALGPYLPTTALLRTPSELSNTVVSTVRFELLTHASSSECAIRTRPHAVYSHNDEASSSKTMRTTLQGRPFLVVRVATRPSLTRLRPPSVAAQSASAPVEEETPYQVRAQAILAAQGCGEFAVVEIGDAAVEESKPQSTFDRIGENGGNTAVALCFGPRPGYRLDTFPIDQMDEAAIRIGNPDPLARIGGYRGRRSRGEATGASKSTVLKPRSPARGGDPNATACILGQRPDDVVR